MLTLEQVLEKTGISRATLYNWKDYGLLPEKLFFVERLGKRWKLSISEEAVEMIDQIHKMKKEGKKFDAMLAIFRPITLIELEPITSPAGYSKLTFLLSRKMFDRFVIINSARSADLFTEESIEKFRKNRVKLSRQSIRVRPQEDGNIEHTIFECGLFEQEILDDIVISAFVSAEDVHNTVDVFIPVGHEVKFREKYSFLQERYAKMANKLRKRQNRA
ncbi:MAG: hypothetical protein K8R90_00375 [Candidatus Cloacimonetes bacterium]|nr:hypothetical protein [Candidatus Cloacimonadota bacterium]